MSIVILLNKNVIPEILPTTWEVVASNLKSNERACATVEIEYCTLKVQNKGEGEFGRRPDMTGWFSYEVCFSMWLRKSLLNECAPKKNYCIVNKIDNPFLWFALMQSDHFIRCGPHIISITKLFYEVDTNCVHIFLQKGEIIIFTRYHHSYPTFYTNNVLKWSP